ncbi:DUF6643 family protein [Streptomyces sp. 8L]|uniref:DUF6643 family protein n=1 Tax=Streptomyces sp. 8L TaxID=2877242 RepID=UPI001CD2CF29|nr:DUF6643 family protein [Streptomyces sp. 8L]MCA1223207.1 hypothetical protein [Streptomyces sp. 8L]
MTSPRSYGGGYYTAPSFPDTPIYDSLVAERGTPQIAPIRVPSAYDSGPSYLPALPSSLPALPPAPSGPVPQQYGYPQPMQQPVPLQQAPAPYIPQQAQQPRGGYPGQQPGYQQQPQRPMPQRPAPAGYDGMRPAAPMRPAPAPSAPGPYEGDPYNRPYQGRGY